jgi:DNA-binding CsgD family transcriptional regulator
MATGRAAPWGLVLQDRRYECAALDGLLDGARAGQSATLILHGDPGVGKTALIEHAIVSASGLRVLRAAGVESEMELAFAALQRLCAPLLDYLDRLPSPQRDALSTTFGLSTGPAPDRFFLGLAVLGLLSEAAQERPLLCVIDDAQWLDRASAQALAFVARRVRAESVALLFALRELSDGFDDLPQLTIEGLTDADARQLLDAVIPGRLDEQVADQLLAEARGNPLALLELPRGISMTRLAGGYGLPAALPLSGRIEASFRQRLEALPDDTQRLLLVAAADGTGDSALLWRAAERLGIARSAIEPAESAGLIEVDHRVRFRHPLVRTAVYGAALPSQRRQVHEALAESTYAQVDPDRRAWHLAEAADGPDENVADELERAAGRAQARGGLEAAAAFLQRAVALQEDPARRAKGALAAAQANLQAGAFDSALGLLATAETGALDEFQRGQIDLLHGEMAFASGMDADAAPLLLKAAKRLASLNLDLARETYLSAWAAAAFGARDGAGDLPEVCRAARALPQATHAPRALDLLLDGLTLLITEGRRAAAPTLRQAASVFGSERVSAEEGLRWGWLATAASFAMWDNDGARAICARQIQLARDTGALEGLPLYLVALGVATAWSGDLPGAASLIAEFDEVIAATGARIPPFAALLLASLRGREVEAATLIDATLKQSAAAGHGAAVTEAHWVAALLENGLGRHQRALTAAKQATSDPLDLYPAMWALPELVEAAARCGDVEIAWNALERLADTTRPSGTDFGLGIEARSRALLSDGEAAESSYREAIDRLTKARLSPEIGRAHLLYGEWLRRERRRKEARAELRAAHDLFTSIGMEGFAERASKELTATGEKVRKLTLETRDDLTDQERRIAHLARDGLSNAEIGERLFISQHTIAYHLRKIFSKLGITSRNQLARVLPEGQRAGHVA